MTTIDYYNNNAKQYAENTFEADMSENADRFLSYLPKRSVVLDLGCGSGRDSVYFMNNGFKPILVDGSFEICKEAETRTGLPVRNILFEDLDYINEFDGVWACASLLHVEKDKLQDIMQKIAVSLKLNGIFYCCFKYGTEQYEKEGRLYSDYTEDDIAALFPNGSPFIVLEYWITDDRLNNGRNNQWLNIICKKAK